MPNYRFQCDHCGEVFFKRVSMGTKKSLCKCGKKAKKVFALFKGAVKGTFGELHL